VAVLLIIPLILLVLAVVYGGLMMDWALRAPSQREERRAQFRAQRRDQRRAERMAERSSGQFVSPLRVSKWRGERAEQDPIT
jgi:hypothetical protein